MLDYVVCEIFGKQYKFIPGKALEVYWKGNGSKDLEVNVLFLSEDGRIKIGKPYLKEKINLKVLEEKKGSKITVRKYHAKANYRRTIGSRPILAKLLWDVKKPLD